jgi:hypothetical protein
MGYIHSSNVDWLLRECLPVRGKLFQFVINSKTSLAASTSVFAAIRVGSPDHPHGRRIMAGQQGPRKSWTKPVLRRLAGEDAERARTLLMERSGLPQAPFKPAGAPLL